MACGDVVPVSLRARQPSRSGGRRRHKAAACLPLDVIVEIAARSDAATLVRCAATCRGARRRFAEDADLRGRLRLRDTGRFLLPLLRGHLAVITSDKGHWRRNTTNVNMYLVDTATAADATRVVDATFASAAAEAETLMDAVPMDSRGGLVLLRATAAAAAPSSWHQMLLVCNPATGGRVVLPLEPEPFPNVGCPPYNPEQYVLLVGDRDDGGEAGVGAAVGRPFQVLKAKLVLSESNPSDRRLMVQTFTSEHGAWSPRTEIPTPNIHGRYACYSSLPKVLVVGDVVHWLCLTDAGSYVLMLHVSAARVSETALPATFPHGGCPYGRRSYLLVTDSAGGSPVVLVADAESIRAWEQCKRTSKSKTVWKAWPQVVIEREAVLQFNDEVAKVAEREEVGWTTKHVPELLWFGERSGAVLLRIDFCLLWLDLHSKKIVRCLLDRRMHCAQVNCPYENLLLVLGVVL